MTDPSVEGCVGFIGCGAMARALSGGLAAAGIDGKRIFGADPAEDARVAFERASGGTAFENNAEVVARTQTVVLAVKPNAVVPTLRNLSGTPDLERPLWISVAAGIRIKTIAGALPTGARIVRSMPNTPALVGHGATALSGNPETTAADMDNAQALFQSVGITWRASDEEALDAVTALSGSGAAYVFLFLEALEETGEELGLPRDVAAELALQTAYGAATLLRQSDASPAALRQQVTSPGGTTLAALESFESDDFRGVIRRALAAAQRRSIELSQEEE